MLPLGFIKLAYKLKKNHNICIKGFSLRFSGWPLYLLIPQAVDQGIQHWDPAGVEHRGHVLLGRRRLLKFKYMVR